MLDNFMDEETLLAYLNFVDGPSCIQHYGVEGQKWGVRRYQNEDGSLTALGREHYGLGDLSMVAKDVDPLKGNENALKKQKKLYSRVNKARDKDAETLLKETREYRKEKGDAAALKFYSQESKKIAESEISAKRLIDEYIMQQFGEYAVAAEGENEKELKEQKKREAARIKGLKQAEAERKRAEKEQKLIEEKIEREEKRVNKRNEAEHDRQMALLEKEHKLKIEEAKKVAELNRKAEKDAQKSRKRLAIINAKAEKDAAIGRNKMEAIERSEKKSNAFWGSIGTAVSIVGSAAILVPTIIKAVKTASNP